MVEPFGKKGKSWFIKFFTKKLKSVAHAVNRQIIEKNTAYNIEFIELLSEKALEYEKETGVFEVTEF